MAVSSAIPFQPTDDDLTAAANPDEKPTHAHNEIERTNAAEGKKREAAAGRKLAIEY